MAATRKSGVLVLKNLDTGMLRTGTPFFVITVPSFQRAMTWKRSAPRRLLSKQTQARSVTQITSPPFSSSAFGKQHIFPSQNTLLFVANFCVTIFSLVRDQYSQNLQLLWGRQQFSHTKTPSVNSWFWYLFPNDLLPFRLCYPKILSLPISALI